jgi:hypothetical protein
MRYIPDDCNLHTHCREYLRFQPVNRMKESKLSNSAYTIISNYIEWRKELEVNEITSLKIAQHRNRLVAPTLEQEDVY